MTLADQATMTGQDGRVTSQRPDHPQRRTFTKTYKARILAAFDALPEGSPEHGALLRSEKLYHSHIEHGRKQAEKGTLAGTTGKPQRDAESQETAESRAEVKRPKAEAAKLQSRNAKLSSEPGKTKTALDIAGKAFALLRDISSSADSTQTGPGEDRQRIDRAQRFSGQLTATSAILKRLRQMSLNIVRAPSTIGRRDEHRGMSDLPQ